MSVADSIHNVLNYFHKDESLDRATFGISQRKGSFLYKLITWRLSDALLIGLLWVAYTFTWGLPPFERQFVVNDPTINHPFAEKERVDGNQLFIYSVWIPASVILVVGLLFTKPKNKIYVTYVALIGLGLSTFATSLLTNILKNYIGRHRPDFISRCIPKPNTPHDVLVFAKDVCTTTDIPKLLDGFRTTPSGHSSLAFSGLLYLSYFLSAQLVAVNEYVGAWRLIIAGLPTLGATLIALSRTEDYRHHFVDIIIGSIIGALIASWSYFRLFPNLFAVRAFEPILLIKDEEEIKDNAGQYNIIPEEV